ncbi:hypothetical protein ACVBEQ_17130 [Nakamurella sp. GG22]
MTRESLTDSTQNSGMAAQLPPRTMTPGSVNATAAANTPQIAEPTAAGA